MPSSQPQSVHVIHTFPRASSAGTRVEIWHFTHFSSVIMRSSMLRKRARIFDFIPRSRRQLVACRPGS